MHLSDIIIIALLLINIYVTYYFNSTTFKKEKIMAKTLEEVLADVKSEATVDDSLIALTSGLKAQLDAVLAGNLTPDQQAEVDAIFDAAESNKAKVADAVTANTPAAPATT